MDKVFGFIRKKNFFKKKIIIKALKRLDEINKSNKFKTNYKNIREIKNKDIVNEKLFFLLMKKIKKKFELVSGFNDLKFKKLWLVNSTANETNKNKLPYVLHIDKQRYFKAMVYLHNIENKNGPIMFGEAKNKINIEKIRLNLPHNYKKKKLNIIQSKHINKNLSSMTGKAGDVIFFDTNIPHKASIIKKGCYRKILRFDFERPSFNSKLPIFFNKIKYIFS